MARILGLDLGNYSVKAVVADSTSRGQPIKAAAEALRGEGEPHETLKAALALLATQISLEVEQVVVALPGPNVASHLLTLPFVEPKRIEATLPFELEGQLPFDLSEAMFDFEVVSQKEKSSELLVGVTRKEELRALLSMLAQTGLDPRVVTHPGLAFHAFFAGMPSPWPAPGGSETVAVVDLGHERCTVAIGQVGRGVEFARVFPGGGKDLTCALANEYHIAPLDAAKWKEAHGALAGAVRGPDAERAAAAFNRGLLPLVRELRSTFKAYSVKSRRPVGQVLLCGGTARLPGLDEQLQGDLGIPVQLLALPPEVTEGVVPKPLSSAQAFALSQRGYTPAARGPKFNLRKGEFAFRGEFDYVREKARRLVAFAAILLILLIGYGVTRNVVLASKERQIDSQLCQLTKQVLGQCETNYDRALNLLRGKESPAAALPKISAVNLLAALTEHVPEGSTTFDQIQVDLDRISLRGETDNSKEVDKITNALKTYRCFREVKPGKVEKTRTGNRVSFNLDIQVECPEQAQTGQG